MYRHMLTTVVLSMIVLSSGRVPLARGTTEDELQEWMQAQLNERLYDSCRTVKLKREEVEVYQGFAEFINGQRTALTVTVADNGVTYKLGKSRPAGAEPNAVQLGRWEVIISRQKMEIARLEALCRRAGIDPNTEPARTENAPAGADTKKATAAAAPEPVFPREQERAETDDLHDWQLAKPTDGAPVPLDLSLGQWLKDAYETLTQASGEPAQVDVAEEGDRIVVKLAYQDAQQVAHRAELRLTCRPLPEPAAGGTTASTKRVCVPASIRIDGQEEAGPAQAWEVLATWAGRPVDQK